MLNQHANLIVSPDFVSTPDLKLCISHGRPVPLLEHARITFISLKGHLKKIANLHLQRQSLSKFESYMSFQIDFIYLNIHNNCVLNSNAMTRFATKYPH